MGTTLDTAKEIAAEARERLKTGDAINHPNHYNVGKYEVIDVIADWKLNFNRGNAVKYIARAGHKGDGAKEIEDLEKARFYIDDEIARLKGEK